MNYRTFTTFCLTGMLTLCISFANAQTFFTEDFDGGIPADWSSVKVLGNDNPSAEWFHTTTGPGGDFAIAPLNSTTQANGWIIFDSDLNCNINVGQNAWLISPVIDASDKTSVFLVFETYYRAFNDRPQLRIGTDLNDLDSWAAIEVFPGVENNEYSGKLEGNQDLNPLTLRLDISEFAAGEAAFYFAFQFLSTNATVQGGDFGCAYSWQIDDVSLTDMDPTPENNLVVTEPRRPFNFATPISQVDEELFIARIRNAGTMPQTGVMVQVEVEGDNGDSFSATEEIGTIAPMEADTVLFEDTFTATGVGNYTFTYTVTQNETDNEPQNNMLGGEFVISQSTFAKDDGIIVRAAAPNPVVEDFWEVGNYYIINNDGFEVFELDFMVSSENNVHQGQTVTVFLYRIEDDGNSTFDDGDLVAIGFNTFTFTVEENFTPITVELKDLLTQEVGVAVTPGEYLATIQLPDDISIAYSTLPYYYDIATVVKNGQWFTGGFGAETTAFLRMRIREVPTSTEEPQLADEQVTLYPNPVNRDLTVQIELQNVAKQTQVQIMDATGRTIWLRNFDGVQAQTLRIDASQWPAGAYFLHVRTDEGVKTKRFVVQR